MKSYVLIQKFAQNVVHEKYGADCVYIVDSAQYVSE